MNMIRSGPMRWVQKSNTRHNRFGGFFVRPLKEQILTIIWGGVSGYGLSMDFLLNWLLMSWYWGTMAVTSCQLGDPQFTTSAILSGDAPNWSCSNSMSRGIIDIPFYVVRQKYIWYWCTIDTIRILGYKRYHQGLVSRVSRLEKDGIIELSSPFLLCENLWRVENKEGEGGGYGV